MKQFKTTSKKQTISEILSYSKPTFILREYEKGNPFPTVNRKIKRPEVLLLIETVSKMKFTQTFHGDGWSSGIVFPAPNECRKHICITFS